MFQNQDVTESIRKVAAAYDCKIVEGILSHQLKQFVIDENKVVLSLTRMYLCNQYNEELQGSNNTKKME